MSARCDGNVYFNNDAMLHVKSFQNVDGTLCQQDARTRFAYLVISKADALNAAGSLEDDKAVVEAVKGKYAPLLFQAIEKEKLEVSEIPKLLDRTYIIDGKLVHLFSVPARNVTCEGMALRAQKFDAAYNELDAENKVSGDKRNVSYLFKTTADCRKLLAQESRELNRIDLEPEGRQPYALISVPYVFNALYGDHGKNYECTPYEGEVNVSLMPKVRVEYGVFFDGTNNNMYNIDFYQDYKKFMIERSEHVRKHAVPFNAEPSEIIRVEERYTNPTDYIATHPDPQKNTEIMNQLRNEIISSVRYFEQTSNLANGYDDGLEDKASKDADKIFDFLKEVRDTAIDGPKSTLGKMTDYIGITSTISGTAEEIRKFLVERILPDDADDSSYTNGYTNIKRLYEHYRGSDRLLRNPKAHKHDLKCYKVYASGSGTVDPDDRERLDDDEMTGLGLGMGATGVKAHVIYTCEKIAAELRQNNVDHIDELVLDVFGFSRGATEARHFACSILNSFDLLNRDGYAPYALNTEAPRKDIFACFYDREDGLYTKIGSRYKFNPLRTDVEKISVTVNSGAQAGTVSVPNPYFRKPRIAVRSISFRHANIGDTVTHYGLMQSNDSKDLNIRFEHDKIGSVFHIMAFDEYRYNFEAHSIFDDDYSGIFYKEGNFKEFTVPGAHADVGGGYEQFGPLETVKLWEYGRNEKKIELWNKKLGWIDHKAFGPFKDVSPEKKKETGFYIKERQVRRTGIVHQTVYMHRRGLSFYYELVALRLMHDEAVDMKLEKAEEDRLPMEPLLAQYDLNKLAETGKIAAEEKKFLQNIYNTLSGYKAIADADHRKLRQMYLHHSSSIGLVNGPSMVEIPKGFPYGKRVVYGATGNVFS